MVLAAGLALAPTTDAAASAAVVAANGIKLPVSSAGAMIDISGQLWVSAPSTNQVDVFSPAGTLLHRVIDLPGARGLLLSSDGSTVEVAESDADAVAEISTTTYTSTGSWATDPCPSSLAWVSGLLAYSFGCNQGADTGGVATLAAPGSTPTEMLSDQYDPPLLAGSGTTLAVSRQGLSPGSVITYTVAENGTSTQLASIAPDEGASMAFSPDGMSLLLATYSDNGAVAYNPTTGAQQIAYPGTGSSTAVGISPNGRYVATGMAGYSSTVNLVDTSTDSTAWTRLMTEPPNSGTTYAEMLSNTLTFSSTSSEVFGLATFLGVPGVYLFASDLHPAASHLSIKVAKVPAGHKLPVTLTGTPGAIVSMTVNVAGVLPHKLPTVTLPASGHATRSFASTYSGAVVATVAGDAAHLPTTAHVAYSVASRSVAQTVGGHKSHNVTHYTKLSQVRVSLTTKPLSDATYSATPQAFLRGHWVSGTTLRGSESNGRGGIYFKSILTHVKYRVKFTVPATTFFRASAVTSGEFELR